MVKVTVAIPIYNAARHLKVTLDSLVHQTLPHKDFEVICVNDCSTDHSEEVVKSFYPLLPNLKLINRKENSGGPMTPRNDAIEAAQGDYLLFLDNDDFLGEESLERLYNQAVRNRSDVIYGRYVGVNGRKIPRSMFKKGNLLKADLIKDRLVWSLAPHKMYRVGLLRDNGLRFHPKAVVGEDQLFTMQCYIKSKVITVLNDYDYYYVVKRGDENLSLKYFPAEQFFFSFNHLMAYMNEHIADDVLRRKLKIEYLNRFFKASRLRKYLLTKSVLNHAEKKLWLNEAKKFIETHVVDVLPHLDLNHRVFAGLALENNLATLKKAYSKVEQVTPQDVSRIEDGKIYARFIGVNKKNNMPYDVELVVNSWNISNLVLDQFQLTETTLTIEGQFFQSLLSGYKMDYELTFIHRGSNEHYSFPSMPSISKNGFKFTIDYNDLFKRESLSGSWDLYVEAKLNGYTNRCRLCSKPFEIIAEKAFTQRPLNRRYMIKPFWTTPDGQLSLEVKDA
ncbi:glycosyltransferase [Pullulanibacillus sp. KACC 23026]|uniref:glycosyltransferase n=1 Tax=Pullulanibacillus sp. KACC 23026 TaxID=3028315 RepID=UPI0023AF05FA|nr:glycosyltransferase [Pullulanibacillus sp. KACC 23026]WEG13168.1 glycosyltransferase [Pullulanibacillus sp. KACC 23026]